MRRLWRHISLANPFAGKIVPAALRSFLEAAGILFYGRGIFFRCLSGSAVDQENMIEKVFLRSDHHGRHGQVMPACLPCLIGQQSLI